MVEPGSGTAAGPAKATEEVKTNAARRVNTNFIAWESYLVVGSNEVFGGGISVQSKPAPGGKR